MTIQSWKSPQAQAVFLGKGFPADLIKAARRRLQRLDAAAAVEDLRAPPSHRLHPLEGDRAGEWSINVNAASRFDGASPVPRTCGSATTTEG